MSCDDSNYQNNNLPQIQMTGNAQTMKINIMKSTRRMY